MKILLAIDGSACSDAAVRTVCRRPWPEHTRLVVLGVAHTAIPESFDPMLLTTSAHLLAMATERERLGGVLAKATAQIRSAHPHLDVDAEVAGGVPRRVIPDRAREWGADLIVVGCHGHGLARRLLLGSVSHAVSLNASCSVEIVRAAHAAPSSGAAARRAGARAGPSAEEAAVEGVRILLATDGSPCSEVAVTALCGRPWPPSTRVRLLGVAHSGNPGSFDPARPASSAHHLALAAERERLAVVLSKAQARVRSARPELELAVEVLDGNPPDVIVRRAGDWPADLVMVGCHGYRTARRLLLGSVSHAVGLQAPCSVQIVRGDHQGRKAQSAA